MPENWYDRMDTIANYQQDSSAQMRLNSWGTAINIANDRPLVGAGFEVATLQVYARYSPDISFPPQVAHSIYFQALGEHGWAGLLLYLWLLWMFWRHAGKLVRETKGRSDLVWAHDFGRMLQVSLVAFAVGGAFLTLILYDVPYYLLMILVVMRLLVAKELKKPLAQPATPTSSYGVPDTAHPQPASPYAGGTHFY